MLPLLTVLLSTTALAAPPPSDGAGVDEQAFLASLPELARLGGGQRFAFRYRTVQFDETAEDGIPTVVRDGVLRIEYRPDGLLIEVVLGS